MLGQAIKWITFHSTLVLAPAPAPAPAPVPIPTPAPVLGLGSSLHRASSLLVQDPLAVFCLCFGVWVAWQLARRMVSVFWNMARILALSYALWQVWRHLDPQQREDLSKLGELALPWLRAYVALVLDVVNHLLQ